jgi:carbonic anhydrase
LRSQARAWNFFAANLFAIPVIARSNLKLITSKPHNNALVPTEKASIVSELIAGTVVFLVALPLCLGIALASGAPLFSGIVSGVVGGIVVGTLSGSRSSVSGPAAGLTAIVAAQIATLGSFNNFLFAVILAGFIQVLFGIARAGALSSFVPTSVINGLLAAIGVILILKQIPHLLGHDSDPEGEMSFEQPDHQNTFTELFAVFQGEIHSGAVIVGLISIAILVGWTKIAALKKSAIPAPLVVVLVAVLINEIFKRVGGSWVIEASHLVEVPIAQSFYGMLDFLIFPDFSLWKSQSVYFAGITIALVASLETLLNVEAVDKLDKLRRRTPTNRELIAQGIGNIACGFLGGLPLTSVIVRGSVNIHAGAKTKISAVFHGFLLFTSVVVLPQYLNLIPLSCLAAILWVTGFKLASPTLFRRMAGGGRYEFLPFIVTLLAIVFTDLLVGILIGLAISVAFILNSSLRSPVSVKREKHVGGDVTRVTLANQVSFLNKAALENVIHNVQSGTHLLLDASNCDYIDPDILALIRDFRDRTAPAHSVELSLCGFGSKYGLEDDLRYADYSTLELQQLLLPDDVLELLREGNRRFVSGDLLHRDYKRQLSSSAKGQYPYAVVLSCIDSRAPVEPIMDLGLGDVFSVRLAGNVTSEKVLGSIEYACAIAGAKLVLVLGHTKCGAVAATVDMHLSRQDIQQVSGCQNLPSIVQDISSSIDDELSNRLSSAEVSKEQLVIEVTRRNVLNSVRLILTNSSMLADLVAKGRLKVVGGIYNVESGSIDFMETASTTP